MVHNLALVLGGGGAAGQAWQIGVIAGLAETGLDLTEAADLVIGTSSGSTTAAWVRSGSSAADLLASVLSAPDRPGPPAGPSRDRPPSTPPSTPPSLPSALPMAVVFERMRAIGAVATSAAELRRAMGAFGLESDSGLDPAAAGRRRAVVASRLPRHEWPDRPMIVVAVDAHTGELAAFDRDSGVDLVDAVTASTALPGGPTHDIDGTHYINGGVRSGENADLASGYAHVLVLSPFGGWVRRTLPPGQFEGLRRDPAWGTDLAGEVEALREQGSRVTVITPDADSLTAMGTNQMDPATPRPPPPAPASPRAGRRRPSSPLTHLAPGNRGFQAPTGAGTTVTGATWNVGRGWGYDFTVFGPPNRKQAGFIAVAGRHNGLHDLMMLGGRLLRKDVSPIHRHEGDEILRVVSGSVDVTIGEETRLCKAGDVAVFGPGVPHGFEIRTEAVIEVVAAYGIGTFYPVIGEDGEEWHEVYRRDMPWGRPPPEGVGWTTDDQLGDVLKRHSRPR